MLITSKPQFYSMLWSGAYHLGNQIRSWRTLEQLMASDYPNDGLIGLRSMRDTGGVMHKQKLYPFRKADVPSIIERRGLNPSHFYYSEFFDRRVINLQGEVTATRYGLHGHLSFDHREILSVAIDKHGFFVTDTERDRVASRLIRKYSDDKTWELLHFALEQYSRRDDAYVPCVDTAPIIEITFTDRPVGELGWRSIWWEVRSY